MTQGLMERRVWSNSASGYVRNVIRLILGVYSFRLLCSELSAEELGFYSLVWSFLGYGVLFDFGLGVAVKKRTAELIQCEDWNQLGRILSTVLFSNCLRAVIIAVGGLLGTDKLLEVIHVSTDRIADFRPILQLFFIGMAAMFPLEMFREVHSGQQRIAIADRASTVGVILSFGALVCALEMHWGLSAVFGLQMLCLVLVGVFLVISAMRAMPRVCLGIRLVSWAALRGVAKFSVIAYLAAFAGIVMLQMDRFLISAVLSVSAVSTYHIGAKIPELFSTFTRQLPDALAPAAAAFHGAGQRQNWQRLFLRGIRMNALIATPLFLLCNIFLEQFIDILTRHRSFGSDVVLLGRVLLVWSYSTIITHGISRSVFLMCGQEARLVRILIIEAFANVALSSLFLWWRQNPFGAALGSLIPAIILGWGYLWPWAAREIGTTPLNLARQTLVPAFKAASPLCLLGLACRHIGALQAGQNVVLLGTVVVLAVGIAVAGTWILALNTDERDFLVQNLRALLRRRGLWEGRQEKRVITPLQ